MNKFLLAIGIILLVLGVKFIYDARPIIKTYFSFGDENEAVLGMKILRIHNFHSRWNFSAF